MQQAGEGGPLSCAPGDLSPVLYPGDLSPVLYPGDHSPPPLPQVAPIDVVGSSFIPALFAHATEDNFIKIAHSEKIHAG